MKKFIRAVLTPENETNLESHAKEPLAASPYYPLLKLIAQVCDERARGENIWLNIGTDRGATTLLISLHLDNATASASGATLDELMSDLHKLL